MALEFYGGKSEMEVLGSLWTSPKEEFLVCMDGEGSAKLPNVPPVIWANHFLQLYR
jgi:hypothetical protein